MIAIWGRCCCFLFQICFANYNDQTAEVTPNGGLLRESYPKIPEKFRWKGIMATSFVQNHLKFSICSKNYHTTSHTHTHTQKHLFFPKGSFLEDEIPTRWTCCTQWEGGCLYIVEKHRVVLWSTVEDDFVVYHLVLFRNDETYYP